MQSAFFRHNKYMRKSTYQEINFTWVHGFRGPPPRAVGPMSSRPVVRKYGRSLWQKNTLMSLRSSTMILWGGDVDISKLKLVEFALTSIHWHC